MGFDGLLQKNQLFPAEFKRPGLSPLEKFLFPIEAPVQLFSICFCHIDLPALDEKNGKCYI